MKKSLLALIAFVVFACSSHKPAEFPVYSEASPPDHPPTDVQPVFVDVEFSPPHKGDIRNAINQWNIALNGYRRYDIVNEDYALEVGPLKDIVSTHQGIVILSLKKDNVRGLPPGVLGFVRTGLPVIHIVEDAVGTRDLAAIVMHELGHIMGADHVEIPGVLLNPSYSRGSLCIDSITLRLVAQANFDHGWDWHHMRHC